MAKVRHLADDVLEALPGFPGGAPVAIMGAHLNTAWDKIKVAYELLDSSGKAILVRNGPRARIPGYVLYPPDCGLRRCVVCKKPFRPPVTIWRGRIKGRDAIQTRRRVSKRQTCSGKCHAALGWLAHPEKHAARCKALSASQSTPKALARTAATNKRRWARPGEREKLSEQNKKQWADPVTKALRASAIRVRNGAPASRAAISKRMSDRWNDPEGRAKLVAGIQKSKQSPEARAKFGKLLRERWKDPDMRKKYTAANAIRNDAKARARAAKRLTDQWNDPVWAARQIARLKSAETRNKAVATRKARGWWKRHRPQPEAQP